mmetsp:Transcript_28227/g.56570  ORF Transcript_28227/g.56570 Transcript_28227/m.56570 type:complete len:126 (-) Transcript_28227:157-534(-)
MSGFRKILIGRNACHLKTILTLATTLEDGDVPLQGAPQPSHRHHLARGVHSPWLKQPSPLLLAYRRANKVSFQDPLHYPPGVPHERYRGDSVWHRRARLIFFQIFAERFLLNLLSTGLNLASPRR